MPDAYDLDRFVNAQSPLYQEVLTELRLGRKQGHWMWFIFPQLKGLGHSWMAARFGIASRAEARAYLAHPLLGSRLVECTQLVNNMEGRSIPEIFGDVDALKFRSSMTLFAQVAEQPNVFTEAFARYFSGQPDTLTLERLSNEH